PPRGRTGPTATRCRGSSANRSSVRSISSEAPEPGRLTAGRPAGLDRRPQAHEMGMYKQYSGLIASGRKTTGIRGGDGSRKRSKEGGLLRFECREEKVLTRITRRRPAPRHTGYPPARARSPGRGRDRN